MRWEKLPTTPPPLTRHLFFVWSDHRAEGFCQLGCEARHHGPGGWGGSFGPGKGTVLLCEPGQEPGSRHVWPILLAPAQTRPCRGFILYHAFDIPSSAFLGNDSLFQNRHPPRSHSTSEMPSLCSSQRGRPPRLQRASQEAGPRGLAEWTSTCRYPQCGFVQTWGRHGLCLGAAVSMWHVDRYLLVSPRLAGVTSELA